MKRALTYIPAVAVTLIVPLLSLINPEKIPDASAMNFAGADKVVHAAIYAVLTCTWILPLFSRIHKRLQLMVATAVMASLYGLLMEVCQYLFTDTRSMDILDAAANLAGAITAAMAIYWITRFKLQDSSSGEDILPAGKV